MVLIMSCVIIGCGGDVGACGCGDGGGCCGGDAL